MRLRPFIPVCHTASLICKSTSFALSSVTTVLTRHQNNTTDAQANKSCDCYCTHGLRIVDPGEHNDLAADPKMANIIANITARVESAAATGPPWAWPMEGNPLATAEYDNCQTTLKTGFFEPVLEEWPPPGYVANWQKNHCVAFLVYIITSWFYSVVPSLLSNGTLVFIASYQGS